MKIKMKIIDKVTFWADLQHNPQSKWFWAIEKLEHTTNGPKSIGSDTIDQIGPSGAVQTESKQP